MMQSFATQLTNSKLFQVKGVDSEKFLQGQLTADIAQLAKSGHSLASHCNIKGHMVGLFRIMRLDEQTYWLRVNEEIAESAFNNLKKYSIFSKVEMSFLDDAVGFGASEDKALTLTNQLGIESASKTFSASETTAACKIADNLWEIWSIDPVSSTLSDQANSPLESWIAANILQAIPDLRAATQEHFIPQMVNLQALQGVSFSKGCYTGQEIVTRLQHRGILKRAMRLYETYNDTNISEGAAILNVEGESLGEVVMSATVNEKSVLIAVVQQAAFANSTKLQLDSGNVLTNLPLPYELDPRLFESKR
jgi:folate-binding protein YgfZ